MIHPVSNWRGAVRRFIDGRELDRLKVECDKRPTLAALVEGRRATMSDRMLVLLCPPTHANWIRIRLLCGTSALNTTVGRMQRGEDQRSRLCPMWSEDEETVQHFLLDCHSPCYARERTDHAEAMPDFFFSLEFLQKCTFILGCRGQPCTRHQEFRLSRSTLESGTASEPVRFQSRG